ncbi:MAG: hypothetical protein GXO94_05690 [Nitrospirae bacterium]|nr:hypothetical protein [Nitrospirota bacterium]
MKIEFTDFSDVYYGTISRETKPGKRKGKFVQLRNENTEHIVLSPIQLSPFHANIIERFCLANGIRGRYTGDKMERFVIEHPGWKVIGGGHWEMDDGEKRLVLGGASYVYGRFDGSGLSERLGTVDALNGYSVVIR